MTNPLAQRFSLLLLHRGFRFHTRERKNRKSVATNLAELQALGEYCEFGVTLDKMIRHRLVCGINNKGSQRRLFQGADLTYEVAFQKAQTLELAAQDVAKMSSHKPSEPLNAVHNVRTKHLPTQMQSKQKIDMVETTTQRNASSLMSIVMHEESVW